MIPRVPVWLFAAFLAVFCGCSSASNSSLPGLAAAPKSLQAKAEVSRLKDALLARNRRLVSLRTPAVMEYTGGGRHVKAHEEIVIRRPDNLRVEALSPLGVAAVVAANGSQVAIFNASDNTLMRGQATANALNRFAQIPLAPARAVSLLLGLVPDASLVSSSNGVVRNEGDLFVVVFRAADGSTSELGFAGGELAMVRERGAFGEVRYEVHYSEYRDIGGFTFAYHLDADFPSAGTHVKFSYQRPIVNGVVSDSLFILTPGPKTREISLDDAQLS